MTVPQYNGYLNDWVPMIRDAYARGIGIKEIAKMLVECGVKPPFAYPDFDNYVNTIRGIIRSRILKLERRSIKCVVPLTSWTPQDNYEEIESEYV